MNSKNLKIKELIPAGIIIIVVIIVFSVAALGDKNTENLKLEINLWFWASLVSYLAINDYVTVKFYRVGKLIVWIDMILAILLTVGFTAHWFIKLPLAIEVFCLWPAVIGTLVLLVFAYAGKLYCAVAEARDKV